MEIEDTKREPNDSDMILYKSGILNETLNTSKGHRCTIPNWCETYKFYSKHINYIMNISTTGKLTKYKTVVDGCLIQIVREPPINSVFNVIISINENITSRKMPSYKGFLKGYRMKTNPQFIKSQPSTKNILFNNVFQLWKTGYHKYSLDYNYENQEIHITDDIAFAIATTMFHDNE
jgi:hypothetical protein